MLTSGDGRGSAGSRLFSIAMLRGALTHEFPIDSREDSLLALAESRVSFSRLRHRHDRLRIRLVTRRIAEVPGKGVRREPQYPLQLGDPPRLRHGLACKPLGDRRLGDTQRSGKWTAPVILEALIPGRMQSHVSTAEVPRGAARARGQDGVGDPQAGREGPGRARSGG